MIMNAIVTSLEMTSRTQLVPGPPAPAEIAFDAAGPEAADLVRDTYNRIWEPLAAVGRTGWSAEQWARELARPAVHAWLARIHNDIAGLAELETEEAWWASSSSDWFPSSSEKALGRHF